MGIKDLKEQFEKGSGRKTDNQKLHKKFDKQVKESRDARLLDKESGIKKLPAFKEKRKTVDDSPKKPKSSFADKLSKTVKKDEEKKKSGGLSID